MKISSRAAAAAVAAVAMVVVPAAFAGNGAHAGATPAAKTAAAAGPAKPADAMPAKPMEKVHAGKLSHAQVMSIQNALAAKGFAIKADGVWGKKTRTAVAEFQKKSGLPVTGHPDTKTLSALGVTL